MKKYLGGIFLVLILSLNVSANFNQDIADLSNNTDKESYINEVKTNLETANSKVSKKYKSVLPQFVGLISKKFDTEKKLKTFINKLEVIEKKTKSSFKYVLQNLMYNAEIIYLNNYVEVNEDDNSVENNDKKEEEKDDTPAKKLSFINHNFKIEIYEDSPNSGLFKNISSGSGVLIGKNQIITNAHVANEMEYNDNTKEDDYNPHAYILLCETVNSFKIPECKYTGKLIASDEDRDIALIQIDDKDIFGKEVNLNGNLKLKEDEANLGDSIKILGYPGIGFDTVTYTEGKLSGFAEGMYKTDTLIDDGNSGGGAYNNENEIIGLSRASKINDESMNYLVPSFEVVDFLDNLDDFKVSSPKADKKMFDKIATYSYDINHGEKNYNRRGVKIDNLFDKIDKDTKIGAYTGRNYDYFEFVRNKLVYEISISDLIDSNTIIYKNKKFNFENRNNSAYDIATGYENGDLRKTECDETQGYRICRIKTYDEIENKETGEITKKLDKTYLTARKTGFNTELYVEVDLSDFKTKEESARNNIKRIMTNADFSLHETTKTVNFNKLVLPEDESSKFLLTYKFSAGHEFLELWGKGNSGMSYVMGRISELPNNMASHLAIKASEKHKNELTIRQKLTAIRHLLEDNILYKDVKEGGFLSGGKFITATRIDNRQIIYVTVDEDNNEYFVDFEIGERGVSDKFSAHQVIYKSKITQGNLPDEDENEDEEEENNDD